MARAAVEIPGLLASGVRDSVVLLYQAAVEALLFALRSQGEHGEAAPHEARQCRARVTELDAVLAQVGWWSDPPEEPGADVRLEAARDVLNDVLHGALIDAGERLAAACGEGWRAGAGAGVVRAAAMEVIALDGLLGTVRE
jgi:hypothetical protein